ncbi:MAG: hypothetical protein R3F29_02250 [Planctomycetota bacterium]
MTDHALLTARAFFLRVALGSVMLAPFGALLRPRAHGDLIAIGLVTAAMICVSLWWWFDHELELRRVVRSLAARLGEPGRRDGTGQRQPRDLEGN